MQGPTRALGLDHLGLGGLGSLGGRSGGGSSDHRGSDGGNRGSGLGDLRGLLGSRGRGRGNITRRTALLGLHHRILVGGAGVGLLELLADRGNVVVPRLLAGRGRVGALAHALNTLVLAGLLQALANLLAGLLERLLEVGDGSLDGLELVAELLEAGSGRGGDGVDGGVSGGHFVLYLCSRSPLDRFFRTRTLPGWTFLETAGPGH